MAPSRPGRLLVMTSFLDLRFERDDVDRDRAGRHSGRGRALGSCSLWGVADRLRAAFARAGILAEVSRSTLTITSMVFVILIGAALFSLVFRGLGGDDMVHDFLRPCRAA